MQVILVVNWRTKAASNARLTSAKFVSRPNAGAASAEAKKATAKKEAIDLIIVVRKMLVP